MRAVDTILETALRETSSPDHVYTAGALFLLCVGCVWVCVHVWEEGELVAQEHKGETLVYLSISPDNYYWSF